MYGSDWPPQREIAFTRDLGRCILCGGPVQEGHHRVASKMGGRSADPDRHSPEKVVSFCRFCHVPVVHKFPTIATYLGYMVPEGVDPSDVPVWYKAEKSWFYLTAGGTRSYHQQSAPEVQL